MNPEQRITLPAAIFEEMIEHCREGLPNEACGFFGGSRDESGSSVLTHFPLTNAAASPVYYRPDDKQMLAAMSALDESGEELVGIYHSHVASRPIPSPTDVREAHYPDAVYIIVSLSDPEAPEVRGWTISKQDWRDLDGDVEEVGLVIH